MGRWGKSSNRGGGGNGVWVKLSPPFPSVQGDATKVKTKPRTEEKESSQGEREKI